MSNASAPQDVGDAKASLDEHQNVSVSALAANTLVSNRSRSQRRAASRKASRPKKRRQRTKQNLVLQMLRRPSGVRIDDIASKTAWQAAFRPRLLEWCRAQEAQTPAYIGTRQGRRAVLSRGIAYARKGVSMTPSFSPRPRTKRRGRDSIQAK